MALSAAAGAPSHRQRTPLADKHYIRLRVTPLSTQPEPIDSLGFLLLSSKVIADWFGAVGPGPGGAEVEVVHTGEVDAQSGARDVFVQVPRSTAHSVITALPLSNPTINGQSYAIRLVSHADSLTKLAGQAGQGSAGWKAWTQGLKEEGEVTG